MNKTGVTLCRVRLTIVAEETRRCVFRVPLRYMSPVSVIIMLSVARSPPPPSPGFVTRFGFSREIFIKVPNIKFRENPSSGKRIDNMGVEGRTDLTKVIGACRDLGERA